MAGVQSGQTPIKTRGDGDGIEELHEARMSNELLTNSSRPPAKLQEDAPDGLLWEGRVQALALGDVVPQVTEWRVLHDNTELVAVKKRLVVTDLHPEKRDEPKSK
jgi:hypothetical protein